MVELDVQEAFGTQRSYWRKMTSSGVFCRSCIPTEGKTRRVLDPFGSHVRLFAGSQGREATAAAINIDRATEAAAGPEPRDPELRRWGGG